MTDLASYVRKLAGMCTPMRLIRVHLANMGYSPDEIDRAVSVAGL
jgi:hypothetical protein